MNSKRKCAYCKERKPAATMFIRGTQAFCSKEHYIEYQVSNKDKLVKKGRQIKRKDIAERKKKIKSVNDYAAEAQAAVNLYIRLRDYNKPCISCGCSKVSVFGGYRGAGGWDAGHYRSRGAAAHLRFNLLNIHKQCVKCNRDRSGNVVDYRIRLIERIGITAVESIESNNKPRKFTIEYLERIKRIFNRRARHYKKLRDLN
jgi:hypothetical protein